MRPWLEPTIKDVKAQRQKNQKRGILSPNKMHNQIQEFYIMSTTDKPLDNAIVLKEEVL